MLTTIYKIMTNHSHNILFLMHFPVLKSCACLMWNPNKFRRRRRSHYSLNFIACWSAILVLFADHSSLAGQKLFDLFVTVRLPVVQFPNVRMWMKCIYFAWNHKFWFALACVWINIFIPQWYRNNGPKLIFNSEKCWTTNKWKMKENNFYTCWADGILL